VSEKSTVLELDSNSSVVFELTVAPIAADVLAAKFDEVTMDS
jgi:hypothetical protein